MWSDRCAAGLGPEGHPGAHREGGGRPAQRLLPGDHGRDRPRRRRPTTRWAPEPVRRSVASRGDPRALTELRVLEGPNLYFPSAAVKLTLDIGPAVSTRPIEIVPRAIGSSDRPEQGARPGRPAERASGSGSLPAPSSGCCGRSPLRPAGSPAGRAGPSDQRRAPRSSSPTRGATRNRAEALGRTGRRGARRASRSPDVDELVSQAGQGGPGRAAGPASRRGLIGRGSRWSR